ncbi:uncharacterized protein B0I36DRAFT_364624 [Microdochium trichocladiopsis]|uniref:MADS-box MEF2 type transcription factor MIG1 n=1 Tax=Microdochium trichocladiopsis TaxID=1682393 RepID=A0A9P8Y1K4_9PEZI|nr:uncharacterized protein B0I36DRAFT_364624 [Microdochium trichocladiopsis]KAH7027421.1 hypothetical protein B0I36DRAFT_364624 [Microdochium trichocladiopsis]
MGRRKIEIKAIKDDRNRSVTFLKRKGGLFKKAHELSVLCSVDVAVFIFGQNKKLYEYTSGDMRELMVRYNYHGGPNEHKGPSDYNAGGDDDEDEEGQPQFPHLRGHTPSASPPVNGINFVPRGHTPQPQMGSRPSSRNDYRRGSGMSQPPQQHPPPANGYAYMPQPAIYNPQHSGLPQQQPPPPPQQQHPHPQYPYNQPASHPQMQPYMDDQRRSSLPPAYPPHTQAPSTQPARPHPSPPQLQHQHLPPQALPQMSPPQPQHQRLDPHSQGPPVDTSIERAPLAPMDPPKPQPHKRPSQPSLDTDAAIRKHNQRKTHSIFTPINETGSLLSQHLASFIPEAAPIKEDPGSRSQSVDVGAVARNHGTASPPSSSHSGPAAHGGPGARNSVSVVPETTFTPPSRSNSMQSKTGGASRPRLKVTIPDEQSETGSNAAETAGAETATSPRTVTETAPIPRRTGADMSVVLPPPSPSASALLSAGATGPPNPFARPHPSLQNNSNMSIDTPGSALPSRVMGDNFLHSPSNYLSGWEFRGNDSNTLPSPLTFATPVAGFGPSFLRDEHPPGVNKRKSPDISTSGPSDSHESSDAKRVRVDG